MNDPSLMDVIGVRRLNFRYMMKIMREPVSLSKGNVWEVRPYLPEGEKLACNLNCQIDFGSTLVNCVSFV